MLKIRRSRDRLIFKMGIPVPGKEGLYIETRSRLRSVRLSLDVFFWLYITIGNLTRNVHYKTNSQGKKTTILCSFWYKVCFSMCHIFIMDIRRSWLYPRFTFLIIRNKGTITFLKVGEDPTNYPPFKLKIYDCVYLCIIFTTCHMEWEKYV